MANKNFGVEAFIIPTITTNFVTRRGAPSALYDGALNYSSWTPNGAPVTANNAFGTYTEMGWTGSTSLTPPGSGNEGLYIQYDFGQPVSCAAIRYMAASGTDLGAFKLQVSQGGIVWRDFFPAALMSASQGNPLFFGRVRYDAFGLTGWSFNQPVVPSYVSSYAVVDPLGPFRDWPWFMDSDFTINSLFFRFWRLVGISHGAQYTGETERHPFNYLSDFDPIDGRGTDASQPYGIYALDMMTAQAVTRELGPFPPIGGEYTPGSGFFTQNPTVLIDPLNDRAGGRWGDEYLPQLVPPDSDPITTIPPEPGYPGDPNTPGSPGAPDVHGAPVSKPSDFYHPYSRGRRGAKYNSSTAMTARGDGVLATFLQGSPPTSENTPGSDAVDYNFGAAAGNGPYIGSAQVNQRFVYEFPTPVTLTSIINIVDAGSEDHGKWKLQVFDNGGVPTNFESGILDARDGRYENGVLSAGNNAFKCNGGSEAGARGVSASGFKMDSGKKLVIEFDYHDHDNGGGKYVIGIGALTTAFASNLATKSGMLSISTNGDVFSFAGNTTTGSGWPGEGIPLGNVGSPDNKRFAMAVDFTTQRVWVRAGTGNWNGSPSADPATGVGGWDMVPYNRWLATQPGQDTFESMMANFDPVGPRVAMDAIDQTAHFYYSAPDFTTGAIPSGFQAWFAGGDGTSGSWKDIGPETAWKYTGVNSRWGRGSEFRVGSRSLTASTKFALVCTQAGNGGRMMCETVFGIAVSPLAGGPRSRLLYDLETTNFVDVTSTFSMTRYSADGTFLADNTSPDNDKQFQALVSGLLSTSNGGADGDTVVTGTALSCGSGAGRFADYLSFNNADEPAGRFFQFRFARGVDVQGLQIVMRPVGGGDAGFEEMVSGDPTKWGRWKMQWANAANGPYTDAGAAFTLPDHSWQGVVPITGDGQPHGYWRLTKVSGSQTANSNYGWEQVQFLLTDQGPRQQLPVGFTDDNGLVINNPLTISEPTETDPWKPTFRDDEGLVILRGLTIKPNIKLPAVIITDESVFDVFTELSPRPLPMYNTYQKGRV